MLVYRCEDSLEGVFSAIYQAYEDRQKPEDVYMSLTEEAFLFADDRESTPDLQKAVKVMRTLRQRFGEEDYDRICLALAANDTEKAQAVYWAIAMGLRNRAVPGHLLDGQADGQVRRVFELARKVNREKEHLIEFLRFEELKNGILYAKVGPRHQVLAFLMPHFAERFPRENFMIYDDVRGVFGVHPSGEQWYLLKGEEILKQVNDIGPTDREKEYQELFKHFCHKISIEERENRQLQRNLLPLRFREYMVEFQ
ncbi:MAG: TIGR03915 family putative DNA repair protein [Roseburia sp.]|nr:TIGR03915 family putative DNA repair protein [Roseburia sp.]